MSHEKILLRVIGYIFFVLSIGLAVKFGGVLTALVIGTTLAVLVYAGGHISGAHFNPAVTLGLATSGKLSRFEVVPYRVSQLVGASLGAFVASWVIGASLTAVSLDPSVLKILVVELLFTFALVRVVHNVAATKCNEGNSFYGFAIGMIVFVGAVTVGGISGGGFNPAVVIGSTFNGLFTWAGIRPHLVGQLLGGVLAGLVYKAVACKND